MPDYTVLAEKLPFGRHATFVEADETLLRVFTWRPRRARGILLIFHGNSRNASDYRDFAIDFARAHDLVVAAPLFDARHFPSRSYHRGGIVDRHGRIKPARQWTTRYVPMLVDWLRTSLGDDLRFWLWGFSAGAQFLSRVAAYQPNYQAERILIASPSSYVLPDLDEPAPYGFADVASEADRERMLRRYLTQPLTLYVGAADRKVNDRSLSRSAEARRQGRDRVERAQCTFSRGMNAATALGLEFGWRLEIEPGVAHEARAIFDPREAEKLLGLSSPVQSLQTRSID